MSDQANTHEEAVQLHARFDRLKAEVGMGQAQFAREHNVPGGASMLSQHIKGRRPLNLEAALAYAKGFNVTLADISPRLAAEVAKAAPSTPQWLGLETLRPNLRNLRQVPVVGSTQGGFPERIWTDGDYPAGASDSYAECSTTDKNAFLCRVVGDSMSPRYRSGEYCLVEPNTEPEIEDDVLVRLATGETMLKRLLSRRGGIRLGSYNDDEVFTLRAEDVSWMYYVLHMVPPRKIQPYIESASYSGPDRRWVNLPTSNQRREEDSELSR